MKLAVRPLWIHCYTGWGLWLRIYIPDSFKPLGIDYKR